MSRKTRPPPAVHPLIAQAAGVSRVEGHSVPMAIVSRSGGLLSFGVQIDAAPVPTRRYAADVAHVQYLDDEVRLVFAQSGLDSDERESALVVRLNPHASRQFIESLKGIASPTPDQIAAQVGERRKPLERVLRAKQMVKVIANIASVAIASHETGIDFYHASAFALRALEVSKIKNRLELDPVVRVELRTGLFLSLRDALIDLEEQLPPLIRQME